MQAKSANADITSKASTAPAINRLDIGAACSGSSNPGRRSCADSSTGSIMIPPRAGGGGNSSGTSRMRGCSTTGSASPSKTGGGGAKRGNSRILPPASGRSKASAVSAAGWIWTCSRRTAELSCSAIASRLCAAGAGVAGLSLHEGSGGPNFNCSDG